MRYVFLNVMLAILLSWDDIQRQLRKLWGRRDRTYDADRSVTAALTIAALPAVLSLNFKSSLPVPTRLALTAIGLGCIGLISWIATRIGTKRRVKAREVAADLLFAVVGLALPVPFDRRPISRVALSFALPTAFGLAIYALNRAFPDDLSFPNFDGLLLALVGLLFARITISLLESHLTISRWRLSTYYRFAAALALTYALILSE